MYIVIYYINTYLLQFLDAHSILSYTILYHTISISQVPESMQFSFIASRKAAEKASGNKQISPLAAWTGQKNCTQLTLQREMHSQNVLSCACSSSRVAFQTAAVRSGRHRSHGVMRVMFLPIFKLKCRQPSHSSSACALEDPATMMLSQCGGHRRAGSKPEIWSFRTGHALDIQRKHCFPMFSNCFPVFFTESFFHCPLETGGFGGNSSPCRRWANLWWEDTTN